MDMDLYVEAMKLHIESLNNEIREFDDAIRDHQVSLDITIRQKEVALKRIAESQRTLRTLELYLIEINNTKQPQTK